MIDEDPDQPEICQVWFEVKTSKICDRQPNIPLHVLEKDVLNNKIQVTKSGKRSNKYSISKNNINKCYGNIRFSLYYYNINIILLFI